MAKVFITKHALTRGIKEIEAEVIKSDYHNVEYVRYGYQCFSIGTNAFLNKADAIKKAEEMRNKKIASLKKQIEKLEKLRFK